MFHHATFGGMQISVIFLLPNTIKPKKITIICFKGMKHAMAMDREKLLNVSQPLYYYYLWACHSNHVTKFIFIDRFL